MMVVTDNSIDEVEKLKDKRITIYITRANQGLSRARNSVELKKREQIILPL